MPAASSSLSFPLKAAYLSELKRVYSLSPRVEGNISTIPVTGSGTVNQGPFSLGIFESNSALSRTTTANITLTVNGQSLPISATETSYYDGAFNPLGSISSDGEYSVVTRINQLPDTATIGETGLYASYAIYPSSAKSHQSADMTISYVITAHTANTAMVNIVTKRSESGRVVYSTTDRYIIDESGGFVVESTDLLDVDDEIDLTMTY